MSVEKFREALKRRVDQAGSQRQLSAEIGVSQPHISEVIGGSDPSDALVRAIGWERAPVYRRARRTADA